MLSRNSIFTLAAFAAFLGFLTWAGYGLAGMSEKDDHACYAPCTVNFTGKMAEDNFNLDYQARPGNVGVVKVFREMPCDHYCYEVHTQRGTCPEGTLTDPGDSLPAWCKP